MFIRDGHTPVSPDGKQIAFDSALAGNFDIYVVDANGGSARRVTEDRTHGSVPSWSRNGRWIYFKSRATGTHEVWKIPSGGGHAVQARRDGGLVAFESLEGNALYYTKTDENANSSGAHSTEPVRRRYLAV